MPKSYFFKLFRFILFIVLLTYPNLLASQNVPTIICPNYFQYFTEGNQFIGRIILPNVPFGTTKLDVHFSQRSPVQNNNYGQVSLYDNYNATIAKIEQQQPIHYKVTFPTANELPKLTLLSVNDQIICRDNHYPPPSINLALNHKLTATASSVPQFSVNRYRSSNGNRQQTLSAQQETFVNRPASNLINSPSTTTAQYRAPPVTTNSNYDCGREGVSNRLTPFIYGGKEVFRGQFPWLAAIYIKRAEGLLYICGGSLVSTRTVITAAHCFEKTALKANQVLVFLGHHDLNSFSEEGDIKTELQALYMHPQYDKNLRSDADIAILHLKSSVNFSRYIQPICLWRESDDINLIAGHKASVAGWGEDENQHAVSPVPKVVEGDVANDNECQQALRSTSNARTSARSICVSNENGDGPCRGDSGSGLIMKRNGRWTIRGVVSSGLTRGKRCFLSEFVYFCDLAKHSNWLRSYVL